MSTIGVPENVAPWVLTAYGIAEFVGRLVCAVGAGKIRFSLGFIYAGSAAFVGLATILTPLGRTLGTMFTYAICKFKYYSFGMILINVVNYIIKLSTTPTKNQY